MRVGQGRALDMLAYHIRRFVRNSMHVQSSLGFDPIIRQSDNKGIAS